jgi:hypothetical protein
MSGARGEQVNGRVEGDDIHLLARSPAYNNACGKLFALSGPMIAIHALPAHDPKRWLLTVKHVCGRIAQTCVMLRSQLCRRCAFARASSKKRRM